MPTLTVTNFGGPLTRHADGDINSGKAKFSTSWGYDPYSKPGNLTWMEQPSSLLTIGSIAGAVVAMKQHVDTPFPLVYVVTNNGKLRTFIPGGTASQGSVIGSLFNTPSATNGPDMTFYGATEKIFYGDDNGIQKINTDGSGAASIVGTNSVISAVPRPMQQFLGKIYFGNGNNIGEIDTTELITTGSKLSPALPTGTVVRDLDVTPDGNYLKITAMKYITGAGGFLNSSVPNSQGIESYQFLWNGTDATYSSYETHSGTGLTANVSFSNNSYSVGYDSVGMALLSGSKKVFSLLNNTPPFSPGLLSVGNMMTVVSTEYDTNTAKTNGCVYLYGDPDDEIRGGLFRVLKLSAPVLPDILSMPICLNTSNIYHIPSVFGNNPLSRQGLVYLSTQESDSSSTDNYICRLWDFSLSPVGVRSVVAGVYETQNQLFSKKIAVKEVRLYTEPLVAGNSFTVDLIGSGGSVISGGSKVFTVGTNVTAGDDIVRFTPQMAPTHSLGVRITNASVTGVKNWTGTKLEVDHEPAGT